MALFIALVMLVVIGLASAAVMRSALNTDLVANNARVQTLATQAAQLALRYCETQAQAPEPGIKIAEAADPPHWRNTANWHTGGMAVTVPAALLASEDSSFSPDKLPQCLAEYTGTVPGISASNVIVVTARGFSPDYAETDNRLSAGSVVWLQSTLLFN
jgi:type IV pilus assembly protein PilX